MEKGVEGEELDARQVVDAVAGDTREEAFHGAFGAGVAIANGEAGEFTARIQQAEVHAPGVYAEALGVVAFAGAGAEAGLGFFI